MKIENHLLYKDDNTPYPYRSSPNKGGTLEPRYLVMHYTAGPNAAHAINWLVNPQAQASAHLVIARDGSITQLVPFNIKAWHAGQSQWQGLRGLNNYSIGIELDNAGPLTRKGDVWYAWFGDTYPNEQVVEATHKNETSPRGWQLYTPEQLFSALEVSSLLVQYYKLEDIVGHDDIAPGRKSDPGPAFPMDTFRSRVFGRGDSEEDNAVFQTTSELNIRVGPGSNYDALPASPLPKGTRMTILEKNGLWRKVDVLDTVKGFMDIEGWVHSRYIERSPV